MVLSLLPTRVLAVHELSIVYSIVQTVTAALASDPAGDGLQRVSCVRLQVGALSGVTIDAMQFSYDLATEGTALAGSRLEIEQLPVTIYCSTCSAVREIEGVQRFRCPVCDRPSGDIRQGRELEIVAVELETNLFAANDATEMADHPH